MWESLHDEEVQWVVDVIRSVADGVPLDLLAHGGFHALPSKLPHGSIANARPLLHFTRQWKPIRAPIVVRPAPHTVWGVL